MLIVRECILNFIHLTELETNVNTAFPVHLLLSLIFKERTVQFYLL